MSSSKMDVITLASASYLLLTSRRRKRKSPRWWRRELFVGGQQSRNDFFAKLLANDECFFQNFSRMSRKDFNYLLEKVTPAIKKEDTNYRESIPAHVRLLLTLRFLATGDSYPSLMYLFRISEPSISRIIPEVCKAIIHALQDLVKIPNSEAEWKDIAGDFNIAWNYPHCIGACDGKHIIIQSPRNSGSTFYNYKGTFSIVLMAVSDANYCFIYANVGCQGKISDGGVFRETSFAQKLASGDLSLPAPEPLGRGKISSPYVIVADDAFPLQPHIMKPYPGLQEKGSSRRIYNYRHSRARRVVENTFGLLASVFRVFRKPLMLSVENAEVVSTSCIYLHNFLRKSATSRALYSPPGTFDTDSRDGNIIPGSWRSVTQGDTGMLSLQNRPRRPPLDAKGVRDEFSRYFNSEGSVPWQKNY